MISDEAVEAAAKVYRDQQAELGYPKWEDLAEDGREWRRDYMRAALEAAAPIVLAEEREDDRLAEAWEDGRCAGMLFPKRFPNPYTSQA